MSAFVSPGEWGFGGQRALQEPHAPAALEAFAWPPRIDTPYRMPYVTALHTCFLSSRRSGLTPVPPAGNETPEEPLAIILTIPAVLIILYFCYYKNNVM
jgi:hypothetical protein